MRSNSRRQTREQRQRTERTKGVLMMGAAGVVVFAVGTLAVTTMRGQKALDPLTLCPATPSEVAVLVVDVTDPMNRPQQQDFLNQLARLKNSIPRYGQLTVVSVDATGGELTRPIITRCNPGTAGDASEYTGNPAKLQRQWDRGFSKPLDEAFAAISASTGSDTSPILEAVQSVVLTEFQKPGREALPKRLIVASDLLQNTPAVSFYGSLPEAASFTRSDAFRRVRTNLQGVKVELWQIQRLDSTTTQPRALSELWERAVDQMGGTVERVYNVSG